jgi:hypothetical protein
MDGSAKYAIEIVDRWGKPLQRFNKDMNKLDKRKLKDPFRDMNKSLEDLNGDLKRYQRLKAQSFRSDHIRKYNRMIEITRGKINKLEASTGSATQKTNKLGGALRKLGGIAAAAMVVRGIAKLGKASIDAAAKFERYAVTLKTMLGSQGAARERMDEYANIARKTPFQLREVVESGNILQAIGQYSKENLTMLGDIAAASGKPIDQVLNAYSKLAVGEKGEGIRMFRDLLISEKDWQEATGKNINDLTTDEMMKAMPKVMKKKGFFGMMAEQAKTTEGRVSNLGDSFDMLKVAAGERLKPAFDRVVKGTTNMVASMEDWVAVPTAQKIAREKAELNNLVGIITDANTGEEKRSELLNELKNQYPEFLKGLNAETATNEQLRKKLSEVNSEYREKIRLASEQKIIDRQDEKVNELQTELEAIGVALDAQSNELHYSSQSIVLWNQKIKPLFEKAPQFNLKGTEIKNMHDLKSGKENEFNEYYAEWLILQAQAKAAESIMFEEGFGRFKALSNRQLEEKKQELEAQIKQREMYGGYFEEKHRKELLEKARGIDITKEDNYKRLFGDITNQGTEGKNAKALLKEYQSIIDKNFEDIKQWDKLSDFVEGKLKYSKTSTTPEGSQTPNGLDIEEASATITGGGRMVKQVNIEFDSLIGENVNHFRDTDSIEDADDFLTKLSNALQSVVNDTNLASA